MEHDNNYVDLALCQVLGYVSGDNRGEGTISGGGFADTRYTRNICANPPTPEEPALSFREKNGDAWRLRETHYADAGDAIRSMLKGPS